MVKGVFQSKFLLFFNELNNTLLKIILDLTRHILTKSQYSRLAKYIYIYIYISRCNKLGFPIILIQLALLTNKIITI